MESRVSGVDWDALEGPYGAASDVPRLLQGLRADDPALRVHAERELHDHLQHQGMVYPPGAAAVPYLVGLLSDRTVPDRLPACRLLQMVVENVVLWDLSEAEVGPALDDLAFARSEWWLSRSPRWQRAGGYSPPTTSIPDAEAYEAVRAGIPTYLTLLREDDPNLRIGMASLLSHFTSEWTAMSAPMADQLVAEQVPEVAAAICVAVGQVGQPCDDLIVEALSRWRGHANRYVHRGALIGLARVHVNPDTALLAELADCLVVSPSEDGTPQLTMANAAARALGGRRPTDVRQLARLLLARLRAQQEDQWYLHALELLLGIAFPYGPLPERVTFDDLSRLQRDVVHLVLDTGALNRRTDVRRAVGGCNLPYTQEDLVAWATAQLPLF